MSDQNSHNIKSVLQLITKASGSGTRAQQRLFWRTLAGPKNLPEVAAKIELLDAVKSTLPTQLHELVDDLKEVLINATIATTSIKGGTMTLLTTQKSEFKVNSPELKRNIHRNILGGDGE